jgi:hypothetical protein
VKLMARGVLAAIGLRKIPQHAAAQRVKLFSKQAHVIAAREHRIVPA